MRFDFDVVSDVQNQTKRFFYIAVRFQITKIELFGVVQFVSCFSFRFQVPKLDWWVNENLWQIGLSSPSMFFCWIEINSRSPCFNKFWRWRKYFFLTFFLIIKIRSFCWLTRRRGREWLSPISSRSKGTTGKIAKNLEFGFGEGELGRAARVKYSMLNYR